MLPIQPAVLIQHPQVIDGLGPELVVLLGGGGRKGCRGSWTGGGGKTQGPHRPQPGDSRSNPGCGNYLEVGFPPEIFEVFCWFRDQLVEVGCQVLRAEMCLSLLASSEAEALMRYCNALARGKNPLIKLKIHCFMLI